MFFQPYYSQITAPISFSLQQTGFYSPDIRKRRSAKRFRCRLNFDNASYPLLYDHCYRELHWLEQIPREHRRLFRFPLFSKNLQIEKYSLEFQDKKKKEKKIDILAKIYLWRNSTKFFFSMKIVKRDHILLISNKCIWSVWATLDDLPFETLSFTLSTKTWKWWD